jgi:hypothetical protein
VAAKGPGLSKARGRARRRGGLVDYVERRGINKGVFGGNKGWLYVGIGIWILRRMRTAARGGTPSILISEALAPGDRIIIANGRATLDGNRVTQVQSKG